MSVAIASFTKALVGSSNGAESLDHGLGRRIPVFTKLLYRVYVRLGKNRVNRINHTLARRRIGLHEPVLEREAYQLAAHPLPCPNTQICRA